MSAMLAELRKMRRRHDLPLAAAAALFVMIWASGGKVHMEDALGSGYSSLFYTIPLMNTTVMPLAMAALGSRIWEIETKGGGCKLLFTLQSRRSVFFAKAAIGLAQVALVSLIECGGIAALGALSGFTEPLDARQLLWLGASTFSVCAMIYFGALLLSIRIENLSVVLSAGVIGSLSGLFSAFLPKQVSLLLPWGYFVPLSGMALHWDFETRTGFFEPYPFNFLLLGAVAALAMTLALLGRRLVERREA